MDLPIFPRLVSSGVSKCHFLGRVVKPANQINQGTTAATQSISSQSINQWPAAAVQPTTAPPINPVSSFNDDGDACLLAAMDEFEFMSQRQVNVEEAPKPDVIEDDFFADIDLDAIAAVENGAAMNGNDDDFFTGIDLDGIEAEAQVVAKNENVPAAAAAASSSGEEDEDKFHGAHESWFSWTNFANCGKVLGWAP